MCYGNNKHARTLRERRLTENGWVRIANLFTIRIALQMPIKRNAPNEYVNRFRYRQS